VGAFLALGSFRWRSPSAPCGRSIVPRPPTRRIVHESPVEFGGRDRRARHATAAFKRQSRTPNDGSVGIRRDSAPQPVIVCSALGLARYWQWIRTNYGTVRQPARPVPRGACGSAENPSFEVLRISEDGATTISSPRPPSVVTTHCFTSLTRWRASCRCAIYLYGALRPTSALGMLFSVLPFVSMDGLYYYSRRYGVSFRQTRLERTEGAASGERNEARSCRGAGKTAGEGAGEGAERFSRRARSSESASTTTNYV
jgi:hypothetical protein